jgi:DNA polymerase-3 subunit epsilon
MSGGISMFNRLKNFFVKSVVSNQLPQQTTQSDTSNVGHAAMIDVETTGLSPYKDEIIEFAAVLFRFSLDTYEIIDIIHSYVGLREPNIDIPHQATQVHGLRFSDVKGKSLDSVRIKEIIEKADFLIAHNAQFDKGFVTQLYPFCNSKNWVCSMRGVNWKRKGFDSKALQNLLKAHRIKVDRSHRALDDVHACIELLKQRNNDGGNYLAELLSPLKTVATTTSTNQTKGNNHKKNKAGYVDGKHYTEHIERVKFLKRDGDYDNAERLLTRLVDAVEEESKTLENGVTPWYYEQLAIVFRKRKDYVSEIAILERFSKQRHSPGVSPPKLLERLEKTKTLALKTTDIRQSGISM